MDPGEMRSARRHGEYVTALELVAFAVHGGSTESTTTLCLYPLRSTVYLTSQSNSKFEGVDAAALKRKIDGLIAALEHRDMARFWLEHCVLAEEREHRTKTAERRDSEKVDKIYSGLYRTMFEGFLKEYTGKNATLAGLKEKFHHVVVVLTKDIFDRPVTTSGLHGESRIVRYLYIDALRDWRAIFIADAVEELEFTKVKYGEQFEKILPELMLTMASSQPACGRCSQYCDSLGIARGTTGNDHPANWVHPITGTTTSGGITFEKLDTFHAAYYKLYD